MNEFYRRVRAKMAWLIKRFSKHKYFEAYSVEERREMWPAVKQLANKHIRNCRLVENRIEMLEYMPKQATCAEIGIWRCGFSEKILNITHPTQLHLIDRNKKAIAIAREKFEKEIEQNRVKIIEGDSSKAILALPDHSLDWVYIDGDHSYEGVKKDLEAVRLKLKPDGLIAMNDYIFFGTSDFRKYGVIEAANEFCINYDYEIVFYAFQGRMYNDVVLKKL
jgi:predicted O-methyltransferase YrrM